MTAKTPMDNIIGSVEMHISSALEPQQLQAKVKPKLLLHCCCAPCASYVIDFLIKTYEITLFFYNPNIEPYDEYIKRAGELEKLLVTYSLQYRENLTILKTAYDNGRFREAVSLLHNEPEGGARCRVCFNLRLSHTAKQAKELDFDIFATTLSVSPHKNAAVLNDCGIKQSLEHDIKYLVSDFKKNDGYKRSVELSEKFNLYRQNYCGCLL